MITDTAPEGLHLMGTEKPAGRRVLTEHSLKGADTKQGQVGGQVGRTGYFGKPGKRAAKVPKCRRAPQWYVPPQGGSSVAQGTNLPVSLPVPNASSVPPPGLEQTCAFPDARSPPSPSPPPPPRPRPRAPGQGLWRTHRRGQMFGLWKPPTPIKCYKQQRADVQGTT